MAKKADLDLVKLILKRNNLETVKIAQILEELNSELDAQQDEEKPKPVKKQFITLVSDPEGVIDGKDLTGWVVQIPEDDNPATAKEKLFKASYDFNASPKGSRYPVESVGEACESLPAKIAKEHNIWIKTKHPVLMVTTNNKIPMDHPENSAQGIITIEEDLEDE